MNPQFRVDVEDPDESDDDPTGTIVIGLMQMGMREKLQVPFTIGYAIYEFPRTAPPNSLLSHEFFMRTASKARSPVFSNTREVCGRHKLPPGRYVIIPSTFEPNLEAKFLLRIFSEKAYNARWVCVCVCVCVGVSAKRDLVYVSSGRVVLWHA
ncbi:unnamed protein product [Dibothriocephalus latus]|uniref:Peptidase C2 calpain domain-containing protein n=1 Tax=Dibothriocephalus latus TaxID=60516 RepID=A0A3P7Q0T4_DIBLA|nr:unnamed protein product [Dibothriocephalus latus]